MWQLRHTWADTWLGSPRRRSPRRAELVQRLADDGQPLPRGRKATNPSDLFLRADGTPFDRHSFRRYFKRHLRPEVFGPHDVYVHYLRRICVAVLRDGYDLDFTTIGAILGHTEDTARRVYYVLTPSAAAARYAAALSGEPPRDPGVDAVMGELTGWLGIAPTCAALGLPRATYYRRQRSPGAPSPRRPSPRALSAEERAAVLDVLHDPRFVDLAPAEVYATLLDEGRYLCSERTMYRLLAAHQEVRERRNQLRHPRYASPELLARRPNELWSWDITKLLGPAKWTYFYLYVMLDVFSRYVVGWMVAHRESATLAERFIRETCARQGIGRDQLTIHADRGPAMTSKPVALLLADLGVTKTHARPHVSNDNPFSEAQFKTLKYRPAFPERFGSIQDARAHCHAFFPWYNTKHRHSSLGLLTPSMCITAWLSNASRRGRPCSPRPTRRTPSASPAGCPSHRHAPPKCGSTHPRRWFAAIAYATWSALKSGTR